MKAITSEQQLRHLHWRAGFGPMPQTAQEPKNIQQAVRQLLQDSKKVEPLQEQMPELEVKKLVKMVISPEERKMQQQERKQALLQLNTAWLRQMATSEAQLREKLTLFWHGHFACRLPAPRMLQLQNNTLRQHALGKFPDLLMAVAKDPAMLQFLNNQQNRKQQPNENFAREVLELFTIGRGHYTEQDIKEAARAFTGWGYNLKGEFEFRERQHDFGSKTFMGRTGNFNGDDILKIVLENPQTARFLTTKFYTFFVHEVPNQEHISSLSDYFYKSGYNIAGLMEKIFTSDWFYSPQVIGARIKSPVELLVGLQRMFSITYGDERSALVLQRALGQVLFYPPNVSGWAGGRSWIDSSTLAFRLRMGPAILQAAGVEVALKPDDDDEPMQPVNRRRDGLRMARASASTVSLQQRMARVKPQQLAEELSSYLLQTPLPPQALELLQVGIPATAPLAEQVNLLTLRLLSLPEYQLC